MKKIIPLAFLTAVILMAACNKVDNNVNMNPKSDNYATVGNSFSKEDGPIEITITAGHNISECNNSCIMVNGIPSHVDCQGWGDACVVTIRIWPVGGQPKGETFNVVVDTVWNLTTEDYFNMPERSLTVLNASSEKGSFLNIPAQTVYRDSVTQQFTFTGLFFSNTAAYTNN